MLAKRWLKLSSAAGVDVGFIRFAGDAFAAGVVGVRRLRRVVLEPLLLLVPYHVFHDE